MAGSTLLIASAAAAVSASAGVSADRLDPSVQGFMFRRDVVRRAEKRAKDLASSGGGDGGGAGGGPRFPAGWRPSASEEDASEEISAQLMAKAVPLAEYNAGIVARGGNPVELEGDGADDVPEFMKVNVGGNGDWAPKPSPRRLEDGGNDDQGDDWMDDDAANDDGSAAGDGYYMDPNYMYGFRGYSLKFATCQKVQRFSEMAVQNDMYSALVVDDIVILRLCPKRRCKESYQYGCYSGYGEYAIGVVDYLRIMMRYEVDKQMNLCGFCKACSGGYQDDYTGYNGYSSGYSYRRRLDDGGANDGQDDYFYAGDDGAVGDDDATDDAAKYANDDTTSGGSSACDTYADLCDEVQDSCYNNVYDYNEDEDRDDDNEGAARLDYLSYLDYFDCVQVEGNDRYNYWISPRCDPYSSTITMGLFYDAFCSQYAGNEVNLNEVTNIYFQKDIFENFYSGECIECADNAYPPYYNANNNMCNSLYDQSAKCNTYFAYDLSSNTDDDDNYSANGGSKGICAFTESIREGTYDATGQVKVRDSFGSSQDSVVTQTQMILLAVSSALCVVFALYACFVHHEITNLLLKSIAHGHLIGSGRSRVDTVDTEETPSEPSRRKRNWGGSRRGKSRRSNYEEESDSDWDRTASGEYA